MIPDCVRGKNPAAPLAPKSPRGHLFQVSSSWEWLLFRWLSRRPQPDAYIALRLTPRASPAGAKDTKIRSVIEYRIREPRLRTYRPWRLQRLTIEKEKAVEISLNGLYLCRQRPTLPHTFACSTIGPAGLNFRVRDGNGWIPRGMITDFLSG